MGGRVKGWDFFLAFIILYDTQIFTGHFKVVSYNHITSLMSKGIKLIKNSFKCVNIHFSHLCRGNHV